MIYGYNGTQYEAHEAVISPYDHGFLYGMGCFETMRTYRGRCFLLDRHLERLEASLRELGVRWRADAARVERDIDGLLRANGLDEAYVRLSVSAGVEPLGLPAGPYERPNELLMVKPLPEAALRSDAAPEPRALQLLRTRRLAPETPVRLKSFHYMNNIMAKRELAEYPWAAAAEGLMLTSEGWLSEGIVSNVFLVEGRKLATPSLRTGALPGITRAFVLELAATAGLEVEESEFGPERLLRADEAFLTNSVQEIVPVNAVYGTNGEQTPIRCAGPVTRTMIEAYRERAWKGDDR